MGKEYVLLPPRNEQEEEKERRKRREIRSVKGFDSLEMEDLGWWKIHHLKFKIFNLYKDVH